MTKIQAMRRSVIAGAGVLAAGTLGYMIIEKQHVIDALYMTAITVTTVGYREAFPLSAEGRIFTLFLAFAGVGVLLLNPRADHRPPAWMLGLAGYIFPLRDGSLRWPLKIFILAVVAAGIIAIWLVIPDDLNLSKPRY